MVAFFGTPGTTREIALQIDRQIQGFSYFLGINSLAVYGGGDADEWEQQKKALRDGVEVIVATDFSQNTDLANPPVNSVAQQNKETSLDKSLADELAKDSFDEILYDSIGKTRNGNSKGEKSIRVPVTTQYGKKSEFSDLNKSGPCNDGTKVSKEPTLGQKTFHDSKTWSKENNLESINEWEMEEPSRDVLQNDMPLEEKKPLDPEELRAREVVDLVLQEMAEMKKEFKLAKKMTTFFYL